MSVTRRAATGVGTRVIREDDDGDDTSEDDDASGGDVEMALISGEEHSRKPDSHKADSNEAQTPSPPSPGVKQDKKLMAFFSLVFIQGMHVLTFKISQRNGRYRYNTASAIAITELVKFLMSMLLHWRDRRNSENRDVGPFFPSVSAKQFLSWTMLALSVRLTSSRLHCSSTWALGSCPWVNLSPQC